MFNADGATRRQDQERRRDLARSKTMNGSGTLTWGREAMAALLARLREPVATMVTLAALTGLRVGELLAVRWRAIDLTAGTLLVRESVFRGQFQTPKTSRGVRRLPLGPGACTLLTRHHRRTRSVDPDDLIFTNAHGRPYDPSRVLQRVIQPAAPPGPARVTWHHLPHVHSSLFHDLGVPAKVIQQQLGHASVSTTLDIYTHVVAETHRQAIVDLERKPFPNCSQLGFPPVLTIEGGGTVTH